MAEAAQPIIPITTPKRSFEGYRDPINAVAVFPDGCRIATSSHNKTIRLWDLKDGVVLKKMEGHNNKVRALAVSRDGQLIASGDDDGKLLVWHGDTGESLTQVIQAHSDWIKSLDFSPDGAALATGSFDRTTKLWSTKTWRVHGNPISWGSRVICVRYSLFGELAIATDHFIEIWNPRTRESIAKLDVSYTTTSSLAWTPNSTLLLSASIRILELNTWTWQQIGHPWTGHTSSIRTLAVNSTGTLVASASYDNHVRLWRRSDQKTIAIFKHLSEVYCVAFSTDGKHIFSGGIDKKISEWAVPEDALLQDTPEVGSHSFNFCRLSSCPRIHCQTVLQKNN
jgi:WD40 repeat protein